MPEFNSLLQAIGRDPYDDTPRRIAADWLEEHGHSDHADFIRLQCDFEPYREMYEVHGVDELHRREKKLLKQYETDWLGEMPKGWDHWRTGIMIQFRRGFPDVLAIPARTFLDFGAEISKLHPSFRRLVLFRLAGYGQQIAECEALRNFPELELACWYPASDSEAIANSPHLQRLQVLVYWLGYRNEEAQYESLAISSSTAWPNLREFVLLDPYPATRSYQAVVSLVNQSAKSEIAVHKVGFPGLFPFAADFWYAFPGYLPDGRAAIGIEDSETQPPTLCVITFDDEGRQLEEVLRVPMPDVVLNSDVRDWYTFKDEMQQQLMDQLGLQPGFIRVRDCRFPNDRYHYNTPSPNMIEELGQPDTDDEESWSDSPEGYGGRTWQNLDNGEWIFGWDRYGDKTGHIHST